MNGKNRFTNNKYDINVFDINGIHKDTKTKCDCNGFDINGIHKDTKTKCDCNGFDINGIHKDIDISFGEDIDEKKMLKNTLCLENRYKFLKSFIKLKLLVIKLFHQKYLKIL